MKFIKICMVVFTLVISTISFNLFAADFYWVGNSGSWNDASHWALSSGGQGGAGIPSQHDNVIFDNSSVNQPSNILIQQQAFCYAFNFQTNKEIVFSSSSNATLTVNGNFEVNNFYKNEFYGKTIFSSKSPETQIILIELHFWEMLNFMHKQN